jgi:glycosyltransferase involved in cell wall biosynthesis
VEPYGTVYSEAMEVGLPVVGWTAENLPHLARHGIERLMVPPDDRVALAEALKSLALDEPLRRRMSAAAACHAEDFPTWEETACTLVTELRAVLA